MSEDSVAEEHYAATEPAVSIYRGHRTYECAACGRRIRGSSTEAVYVLEDRRTGFEKKVEPSCFEGAREAEGLPRVPRRNLAPRGALHSTDRVFRSAAESLRSPQHGLTTEHVAILRSAGRFPPDATPDEIAFGLEVARRLGLDIWLGQVKFLRFDPSGRVHPFVGIDGMRAIAQRSGQYDGRELQVEFGKGPDGAERPVKAVCRVHRKDWRLPLVEEVRFDEAVRRRKDGQPTRAWREMPVTMLRKVAEERALRAAFPVQLSGTYGEAEAPDAVGP